MPRKKTRKQSSQLSLTLLEVARLYEQMAQEGRNRLPALRARQHALEDELSAIYEEIEAIEKGIGAILSKPEMNPATVAEAAVEEKPKARRGRKPKAQNIEEPKPKRGRKPGPKKVAEAIEATAAPKKRGRKPRPKVETPPTAKKPGRKGRPVGSGVGRQSMTLRQAITVVLSDATSPMKPADIRDEVKRRNLIPHMTGTFHNQITGTLSRVPEFVKTGDGLYILAAQGTPSSAETTMGAEPPAAQAPIIEETAPAIQEAAPVIEETAPAAEEAPATEG